MDNKSLNTLEFPKILDRLAGFAAFSASAALVRGLRPTSSPKKAIERQARTSEAVRLLSEYSDVTVGGARDVRQQAVLASRGGVLLPEDLMDIKGTLISGRELKRFFEKLPLELPHLGSLAEFLAPPEGLIEAISRVLNEKGEIKDSASEKLGRVRTDLKRANDRVMDKLTKIVTSPNSARMLQEAIITKRNERFVVPLKAEYKGRFKCVVQDQSASGATLFVEPMAVVDLNNDRITLAKAEKDEIQRILAELSAKVGENAAVVEKVVHNLAVLDFTLACARYAQNIDASEPILVAFDEREDSQNDPIMRLLEARHPLLDPHEVVAVDLLLEKGTHALVITGPNTGGKTVSLKTAGLLTLMALSGLHIPAQSGSMLRIFKDVYADIGDEQSIEQSLSTFSGHVTNIVRILKKVSHKTLVLFDELGAGTDPQEGSALARGILSYLMRRQVPALVATHYPELKAFAHNAEGVQNASVEFDAGTLQPTYRLLTGVPGRSNALAIARRLGLPDEVLEDAQGMINPDDRQADDMLNAIQAQLEDARRDKARAELLLAEIELEKVDLQTRLENIDNERVQILEEAREQAREETARLMKEINAVRAELASGTKVEEVKKKARKKAQSLAQKTETAVERKPVSRHERRPLRIGDRVHVSRLDTDGIVSAIHDDALEVEIGKMRMKVDLRDVERSRFTGRESNPEPETGQTTTGSELYPPSPGTELKLIGMRAEDAMLALERYLDAAYAAGLPFVRIVHGKGTGTLRQVVQESLKKSQLVERFEAALKNEGGDGATVAFLEEN